MLHMPVCGMHTLELSHWKLPLPHGPSVFVHTFVRLQYNPVEQLNPEKMNKSLSKPVNLVGVDLNSKKKP